MSKSARMQACVFLWKTYTESKKTKIFKEELIFKRIVASSDIQHFLFPPQWVAAHKLQYLHILRFPMPLPHSLSTPQLFSGHHFQLSPGPGSWQPLLWDGCITTFGSEHCWLAFVECLIKEAKHTFQPSVPTGSSPLPLLSTGSGSTSRKALPWAIPE